jgi:uncharacterized protein involved in exopolysaccharide biosynthesis
VLPRTPESKAMSIQYPSTAAPLHQSADADADFARLLATIIRQRWLVLAFVAVGLAAGGFLLWYLTPFFRSTVVGFPNNSKESMGALGSVIQEFSGVASMAGLDVGDNGNPEALAILKSREFNERFITANNMMPILFHKYWDDARNDWKPQLRKVPTLWDGFDYFTKKVRTVTEDRKSGLLTINVDWRDRDLAARWANQLVAQLNDEMRQRAITEANGMITYLTKEMERSDNLALRESVSRLIESEIKQRALATVRYEYAYRVVDTAEPADKRHPIRPLPKVYIVFGALGGFICGVGVALMRRPVSRVRAALRETP